mmetsp:Transcript_14619/g.33868  ORF Transcript_14619/g.33868 Transcript_14619/m.33868 type:complete len:338 (-) Transcript_14619:748-1761(-)
MVVGGGHVGRRGNEVGCQVSAHLLRRGMVVGRRSRVLVGSHAGGVGQSLERGSVGSRRGSPVVVFEVVKVGEAGGNLGGGGSSPMVVVEFGGRNGGNAHGWNVVHESPVGVGIALFLVFDAALGCMRRRVGRDDLSYSLGIGHFWCRSRGVGCGIVFGSAVVIGDVVGGIVVGLLSVVLVRGASRVRSIDCRQWRRIGILSLERGLGDHNGGGRSTHPHRSRHVVHPVEQPKLLGSFLGKDRVGRVPLENLFLIHHIVVVHNLFAVRSVGSGGSEMVVMSCRSGGMMVWVMMMMKVMEVVRGSRDESVRHVVVSVHSWRRKGWFVGVSFSRFVLHIA